MKTTILLAALVAAAPAFAQWPDKPKTDTKTAEPGKVDPAATPPPPPRKAVRSSNNEDDGSGFGLGVRGAWAFPMGALTGSEEIGASVGGQLPVWLEAGYHLNRHLYFGLYYQYAFGFDNCPAAFTCSSHDMRFGAEGIYTLSTGMVQPWVGLGVGYERLSRSRSGDDTTFKGLELVNVQAGLDFAVGPKFTVGPFASYQLLGKFTSFDAGGVANDIGNTSGHSWLQVGLKAGFTL